MKGWIRAVPAALIIGGIVALWPQHDDSTRPGSPSQRIATTAMTPLASAAAARAPVAAAPAAPSWRGTEVDGAIHLDGQGALIPDRALRDLFDYLLSAQGELSLDQIRQRLVAAGQAQALDAVQLAQLSSLFGRYLDGLDALSQIPLPGTDIESLRRTHEARKAARRELLGIEMAEGFFAEDEARDQYTIERLAIQRDRSLTPQAREQALDELRRTQAPPVLRELEARSAALTDLAAATDRLRSAGATASSIQALREREVGSDAAQRLAALDARRTQWGQRVEALRSERDLILASPGLAPEDRQRQIDALIARDFTEPEAARLRAQLGGLTPRP